MFSGKKKWKNIGKRERQKELLECSLSRGKGMPPIRDGGKGFGKSRPKGTLALRELKC